jgi:hypothetical protein
VVLNISAMPMPPPPTSRDVCVSPDADASTRKPFSKATEKKLLSELNETDRAKGGEAESRIRLVFIIKTWE